VIIIAWTRTNKTLEMTFANYCGTQACKKTGLEKQLCEVYCFGVLLGFGCFCWLNPGFVESPNWWVLGFLRVFSY